ncbi:uncharacterized protein [Nicotiana tomentosiformis]|uniref:uncharacterized protein n=1 Tax=Nicotiana tomentosiformis TaxID=4098 RepID=UPI00388C9AFC
MTGIPPEVMTHKLNEDPLHPLVKQKKRKQGFFKNQVIQDEVQKLLKIRSILEVKYPDWGIEVNPTQIKDIEKIPDILTSKKEMQRLTGRIAALGRFISKSSEKSFKFFSVLKKKNQFEWTDECQQDLKDLKSYLSNPPLLAKPKGGKRLFIYLVVSEVTVLADFVADFSTNLVPEAKKELHVFTGANLGIWTLFTDGSSNVKGIHREENAEADALANLASVADVTNVENAIVYGILPEDKKKSQLLRQKAAWYCLICGNSYRKIFGGPLERCLGPSQMEYKQVLPNRCGKTKVRDFIWRNIICRFGVPKKIVCDNGPQFIGTKITEFFQSWHIKRITSAPYHPAANEQAGSTNKVIINNLKKRLEESKGKWPEVLPGVLWAYRTTTKTSTGETLFSLVYGAKALIPVEIGEPSTRYTHATE